MPETSPDPLPYVDAPQGEETHRTKGLVRITMACNERCTFCNVPMERYSRLTPPDDEIEAQLQALIESGDQTLTISGGEPTLVRPRLLALIREARTRGVPFVELQTNAILIDDAYAAELADAGLTSAFISLISHVAEHHDALAGLKGAYPRCLRGIDALIAHGVRVTLNPVTTRQTQTLLPDYVDFVAARLPAIHFLSLSVVQPHGRAAGDPDTLLPDYDLLAPAVEEARRRATTHGIEVVNPYCGLPLCIGWSDDQSRSVEAFEAQHGGWRKTTGLDNTGDKVQGEACQSCALRTRCGGAWRAYWDLRQGRGIHAPLKRIEPWYPKALAAPGQAIVRGAFADAARTLATEPAPTRWWYTDHLDPSDIPALLASEITDVAVLVDTLDPERLDPTLHALRLIAQDNAHRLPQSLLKTTLLLRIDDRMARDKVLRFGIGCIRSGVDALRLAHVDTSWRSVVTAISRLLPYADVGLLPFDPREP